MMNEVAAAVVAGSLLGTIFFGGLWLTVREAGACKQPAFWFFGSLLLRASIAVAGFYFVSGGDGERLVFCLLGFVVARLVVTWRTRRSGERQSCPAPEASHAP